MAKLINQSCGVNYSWLSEGIWSHLKATRTFMDILEASKASQAKAAGQGHSKVFTTAQAMVNPEKYVMKCVGGC